MKTKSLSGVEIKDAAKGKVSAVFSTFNTIDSDGDVTLPGAFEDGTPIRISAYGHASWGGALPVGKGVIRTTETEAIFDGEFFMSTTHGRDTFETVKAMGPLQEWSYSVEPTKNSFGEFEGRRVQFLEKLKGPHEVSPVLAGAGVNTRTLAVKSAEKDNAQGTAANTIEHKGAVTPHETDTTARTWDASAVVAGLASDARPSDLRKVFAWVDPDGDPEAKSSYKFPHHHGVGGAANVRACLAGIAALNGGRGGADIPDADRKAVYNHLAAHLRDADREPPELRSAPGAPTKFNEQLLDGLAGLSDVVDSAARVVALRAEKGKVLSRVNVEVLEWICDEIKRLDALLHTSPAGAVDDDTLTASWLESLARVHNL